MSEDRRLNSETDYRIDLKVEFIKKEDDTHCSFKIIPDPQRYELKSINGKDVYFDKLDNLYISSSELLSSIEKALSNIPLQAVDKKISDIEEYTRERIEFLKENFGNIQGNYVLNDQFDTISRLSDETKKFVILSIDLIDSTKMSQELSDENYVKVLSIFLGEISQLIDGFKGYVLKYTGDGLIAYFPEPNYIGNIDTAIDCAISMKYFILNGLNSIFSENGLPKIGFRIGLDSGEVKIATIGLVNSRAHRDLIGQTVNLAVKIQDLAGENQILAGEATIKNAHNIYRNRFQKIDLPEKWEHFKDGNRERYSVYSSKY
jgi:class 3 adenylate cyclase